MRQRLGHVYWIGGGSAAGKSTLARRLAQRHGWSIYDTDAAMSEHVRRVSAAQAPYLARFLAMDLDQRWVQRTPREMLETFHWYRAEGFHLIIEDLLALPPEQKVIVEGFRLLPEQVLPLLAQRHHAVWLLPTTPFRRDVFAARGGVAWDFIAQTSQPQRALENLLARDALFTDRLADQCRTLGLAMLEVDQGVSEDALEQQIMAAFAGPGATVP